MYIEKIVSSYGISLSIVSTRDLRFMSMFWQSLKDVLGTKLKLNSVYHSQADGQIERTIQSLKDSYMTCVLEQRGSWDNYLPLIDSLTITISIRVL